MTDTQRQRGPRADGEIETDGEDGANVQADLTLVMMDRDLVSTMHAVINKHGYATVIECIHLLIGRRGFWTWLR